MTTVFFAGGEDTSLNPLTSLGYAVNTGGANYRSNFSRCALVTLSAAQTNIPPNQRLRSSTFTNQTTLWAHGWVVAYNNGIGSNLTANTVFLGFLDSSSVYRLVVRTTGTLSQLELCSVNAAGTVTHLAYSNTNIPFNTVTPLQAVDAQIIYGSSGTFNLYINATLVLTYSGNLVTDSNTGIGCVDFVQTGSALSPSAWSELLIQDTDTRGRCVYTIPPIANGSTNTWTGSVSNVNEVTLNDAAYNYVTTASQYALYTTSTSLPTGNWAVQAFIQEARVSVGSTGPQNFDFVVHTIDGSNNVIAAPSPTNYFGNFAYIWPTNPHTSAAWVPSDFGTGFNYGVESIT